MTHEDKQHRRDDPQPHWQNPHQHDPHSSNTDPDVYNAPIRQDLYGNPLPLDYSPPLPPDYNPLTPDAAPDAKPNKFGVTMSELIALVAPADSSYKDEANEIVNQTNNKPAPPPHPSTPPTNPSTTPTTNSHDPSQNIPGLPKQGGKPIPQEIQAKFTPEQQKQLKHINVFDNAATHELNENINAKAFTVGHNIYAGKEMNPGVYLYEAANVLNPKQSHTRIRRKAQNDDWIARQAEIARQQAADRKRIADAKAKADADARDKAAADQKKRDADQTHPNARKRLPNGKTDLSGLRAIVEQGKLDKQKKQQAQLQPQFKAGPQTQAQTQTKPQTVTPAHPVLTPDQQKLLKIQQSQEKAQGIWKDQPPDTKTTTTSLDGKTRLYDQWLDTAKSTLGKGDAKGLEQYFESNANSLNHLSWIVTSSKNPNSYAGQRYKDYLAPTTNPKDHIELIALKQNSLKTLINEDSPDANRIGVNGPQIIRAVTTSDSSGKPVKEYYAKRGGVQGLMTPDRAAEWVKVKPPSAEQVIVTVDATDIAQGKKPKEVGTTVNISGGEQQTKKRYNTIDGNYQTHVNPTFTRYQQLRGDTPRQLSGASLRNELGVAMNFTPNNAPLTEADQKALKAGQWDFFSPDRISPELSQGLNPAQQEKLKEHFKEQHESLTKVEAKIKEIGGDNAKVTTLPIMVDSPELGGVIETPLFRVAGKNGKDQFVDKTGRVYQDFQDWKDNNKLPAGRVSYFADGHISEKKDGQPNIVTENTHAVVDTAWEHVKQVGDWVATGVGIVVGVAAVGALILGTGGLATPLVIAGGAAALWGATSEGSKLYDRSEHGESLSLADAEARSAWIGLTANMVGFAAIGSSIRAGNAAMKVANSVDELGQVTASATEMSQAAKLAQTSEVLNGASTVTDGMALTDSSYGLAKNWDKLSPEQRLFAIGQIGFWSGMTAHSAHQSMSGSKSPYASGDVEQFMRSVGAKPKESLTGDVPQVIPKETVTTTEPVVTQSKSPEPVKVVEPVTQSKTTDPVKVVEPVTQSKTTDPVKGETLPGVKAAQTEADLRNSKEPLHQKASDLDTLYKDAEVAQTELSDATRAIAKQVGGEPLIPPSLKGRERTQEKIQSDYDGDASRITDLARSSVICENPQQVYKALGELESQFKVVRVKDRFEKPVNGYRDMLVNLEMSNGHIVEVQLHVRSVMEVKNGAGHKLYEESRSIYAKAKMEGRELTPQETVEVTRLEQQQKQLYDDAYQNATKGTTPKPDVSEPVSVSERLSNATQGKVDFNLSDGDSAVLTKLLAPHESGQVLPENLKARSQEPIELSAEQRQQLGIYSKTATLEDVARRLKVIENKNQAAQQREQVPGQIETPSFTRFEQMMAVSKGGDRAKAAQLSRELKAELGSEQYEALKQKYLASVQKGSSLEGYTPKEGEKGIGNIDLLEHQENLFDPGHLDLMMPNDGFSINAQNRELLEGYYDVIAHGNPNKIRIDTLEPRLGIDHRTLAKMLKHRQDYNGECIRMLSCSTGALPDGFAQNLSNKMNKEVLAPSDILWAGQNGTFTIGPGRMITNPYTGEQRFVREFPQNGKWRTFKPGNDLQE